jgi:hypothetical protein
VGVEWYPSMGSGGRWVGRLQGNDGGDNVVGLVAARLVSVKHDKSMQGTCEGRA